MELRNDQLIIGADYHLWRDNDYLGIAKWINDPNIGKAFIKEILTDEGSLHHVFYADKWKLAFSDIEDTDIISN